MLRLTNTLTKTKEDFSSLVPNTVHMYNCGPTVYDYAHIGNLRAYIIADILRKTLEANNLNVTQVINVTDIGHLSSDSDDGEDKMTKALKREGKPLTLSAMREIADFYFEAFKKDLLSLNIKLPEYFPFASDHIAEDIALIETLHDKGFTYTTSDGIYFDTTKDEDYGKLGGSTQETNAVERIEINTEKKNSRDFALWKFNTELGYDAPFGKGFPGWHIECSAMSMKYLGETFDIHTGGIEHIPIHHNNEIAQSESATGKPFVNYWIHHNHLTVDGGKMAKSEGTGFTLHDLEEKGFSLSAYRYFTLQARYSSILNFTWEAMSAAQNAYEKILTTYSELPEGGNINESYKIKFLEYINDDLDTPKALALMWELVKDDSVSSSDKKSTLLYFDTVLGLNLAHAKLPNMFLDIQALPQDIQVLITKREEARKEKNWNESDLLREQLSALGYTIHDAPEGAKVTKQ